MSGQSEDIVNAGGRGVNLSQDLCFHHDLNECYYWGDIVFLNISNYLNVCCQK